jgi:hypothetical protein
MEGLSGRRGRKESRDYSSFKEACLDAEDSRNGNTSEVITSSFWRANFRDAYSVLVVLLPTGRLPIFQL